MTLQERLDWYISIAAQAFPKYQKELRVYVTHGAETVSKHDGTYVAVTHEEETDTVTVAAGPLDKEITLLEICHAGAFDAYVSTIDALYHHICQHGTSN